MTDSESNQNQNSYNTDGFASTTLIIWDILKILVVAVIIIIPIRYFIFQPFIVSGSSMEPSFHNGEYLVIDEISYRFGDPQRGQVVVLHPPTAQSKEFYIKRIIGLPGEKIEIDNGKVTIFNSQHPNGKVLEEDYLPNQSLSYPHDTSIVGGRKILSLKDNEYFVMGDNRLASSDSRDWGPLPRKEIVGKVFVRALPFNKFRIFNQTPAYSF